MPDQLNPAPPGKSSSSVPCSICGRPVSLEAAKTDGDGQAVHEKCYLQKINSRMPPGDKRSRPSS